MENKKTEEIMREVRKVIFGKDECIRQVMTAILAGGHILIEDIPGVGKTSMALAFARAMNLTQNRVQFTPDVLPSDIVGFSMFIKEKEAFVYQPGAVMCATCFLQMRSTELLPRRSLRFLRLWRKERLP